MKFDPLRSSQKIVEDFRRYILTTFKTDDPAINESLAEQVKTEAISNGPYLSISPNYERKCSLKSLIPGMLSPGFIKIPDSSLKPEKFNLYIHQYKALETVAKNDHNLVLSTGTSSGKTFSFLLPILNYLLNEREKGELGPGVRAMIIYPMNALANDQLNELRGLLKGTGITYGAFTGDTQQSQSEALKIYKKTYDRNPDDNELISREAMNAEPPNILITNYAMLERLLILPRNKELFGTPGKNYWKYIVLDEAHMYSGAKGSEVSSLLRRLKETVARPEIRFLLTSATLGGNDDDANVVRFANELCGTGESSCPFVESDVVRATYHLDDVPEQLSPLDDSFYLNISECIDEGRNNDEMEDLITEFLDEKYPGTGDYHERIFSIVSGDSRVYEMKKYLEIRSRSIYELTDYMKMDADFLISFIRVISLAEKGGYKLFDSKYHMFVKSIDGVFSTLTDNPHVFIHKCNIFKNPETRLEEQVFEISTCFNCNHLYLVGKIDGNKFVQTPSLEEVLRDSVYMVIKKDDFDEDDYDDDELMEKVYRLCPICGSVSQNYSGEMNCGHNQSLYLYLSEDSKSKMCTCRNCEQTEYRRGMLRQMYLGYDSSTAVISSSLYGQMEFNADHRFLSFSDNRQNAAYFASYLEKTHQNMVLHAAMYRTIMENAERLSSTGMTLSTFHDKLEVIINENSLYSDKDEMGQTTASGDAWAMIFIDAAKYGSNKSFEYLGQIYYDYPHKPISIDGLTSEETDELVNQIVKIARDKVDIHRPSELSGKLWFDYYVREPGSIVCQNKDKKKYEDVLATKRIKTYLEKITGTSDGSAIARKILKVLEPEKPPKAGYYVDYNKIRVKRKPYVFRCTKCLKHTPFNVKNFCYRCGTPTLEKVDTSTLDESNSYAYNYANAPLMALHIKEHTAQLDKDRALEYQNKFKDGELDALSCSTTFEVGVNIGDLNTVLLRNVPPTPANYIQRVGRAGRSPESSAYSITYCKNSPHDANYFHHPLDMIQGKVPVPCIRSDNIRIVIRHIFASALSFFWKQPGREYHRFISEFMAEYADLEEYLKSKPKDLLAYLKSVVPSSIHGHVAFDDETDLTIDIDNFGWVDELLDPVRGRLAQCRTEYESDLQSIEEYEEQKGYKLAGVRKGIEEEDTINYLSRHNIIPKYGFPSEIVELANRDRYNDEMKLRLQRDLSRAISDYAPDSEVIADGNVVRSRYLKRIPSKDWPRYYYRECSNCNSVNIQLFTGQTLKDFTKQNMFCPMCSARYSGGMAKEFIIPKYGFLYEAEKQWNLANKKPTHTFSGEIFYRGNNTSKLKQYDIPGHSVSCAYGREDELVLINRSNFSICSWCGFGTLSRDVSEHYASNGKKCTGKLYSSSLGHVFRTDVFIINLEDVPIGSIDQALSVLSALTNAFCRLFNVDDNEIGGCVSMSSGHYIFVLFDNTPGGAGYVKTALADRSDNLLQLIRAALKISKECTCGNGERTDCACYGCLLNYRNQRYHDKIKRSYVIDALSGFKEE
ncbi:DEAD/DEAH box helicase [Methanomethylophilus alvi]|uniref:DEAD/DEAH box helicase n=1 Tax=Methanomethylophilus alvi TaxID=1291540 RepID=UPI0037DD07CE